MASSRPDRPNIIVFLTDQQRSDTIGALGNDRIRTPHLDRLVEEGTAFTRAWAPSPVCTPSRVSLANGLPPHVNRCANIFHNGEPAGPSFMERLREAGYQSACFGKTHFLTGRKAFTEAFDSMKEGSSMFGRGDGAYDRWLREQIGERLIYPLGLRQEYYYHPHPAQIAPEHHETHWIGDEGVRFIEERDPARPFLLCAHFNHPHPPFELPLPWFLLYPMADMEAPYRPARFRDFQSHINRVQNRYKGIESVLGDDATFRRIRSVYYAMISFIDFQVGRILEAVGEEELDNTLVLFSSDHGEMLGDYGCVGKRCPLEASLRVPLLARWPGHLPAGRNCRTPATLLDVFPTVTEAAGIPETPHGEGESLVALANAPDRGRTVFSQFEIGRMGHYAVTDGTWKYAFSAPDQQEWYFRQTDEANDGEHPVPADAEPAEAGNLKRELISRHRDDGFSQAVEGEGWRHYDCPELPGDPVEGILTFPQKELQGAIDQLGPYAGPVYRKRPFNLLVDAQGSRRTAP